MERSSGVWSNCWFGQVLDKPGARQEQQWVRTISNTQKSWEQSTDNLKKYGVLKCFSRFIKATLAFKAPDKCLRSHNNCCLDNAGEFFRPDTFPLSQTSAMCTWSQVSVKCQVSMVVKIIWDWSSGKYLSVKFRDYSVAEYQHFNIVYSL